MDTYSANYCMYSLRYIISKLGLSKIDQNIIIIIIFFFFAMLCFENKNKKKKKKFLQLEAWIV